MRKNLLTQEATSTRFRTALQRYMAERGLEITEVAELLQVHRTCIYGWLNGPRIPNKKRLKTICRLLDWDYVAFFKTENAVDAIFERAFLSFDAVNHRYKRVMENNSLEGISLVPIAAVLLFNRIQYAGMLVDLRITRTYDSHLILLHPRLQGLGLHVTIREPYGLLVEVLDDTGVALEGGVWKLTDDSVDQLLERLKTFEWQPETSEPAANVQRHDDNSGAQSRKAAQFGDTIRRKSGRPRKTPRVDPIIRQPGGGAENGESFGTGCSPFGDELHPAAEGDRSPNFPPE